MKYKVGDKVRIKSLDWYKEQDGLIPSWLYPCCGRVMTITVAYIQGYAMEEVQGVLFKDFMIEGLVEEEVGLVDNLSSRWVNEFNLPDGYIFKDENGNVINATKIVLEKKKKEYPKTYEECCRIMDIDKGFLFTSYKLDLWKGRLLTSLQKLLVCRDAYWEIAGEEMGLGKPWKPSGNEDCFVISRSCGEVFLFESAGDNEPFEFPTREMRDAFYENFKELIERCKELL